MAKFEIRDRFARKLLNSTKPMPHREQQKTIEICVYAQVLRLK
jgi:hypothetical protein